MKIQTLRLKGYKRFKDLTIDLGKEPKRIVALVGPNGCGKSSVFDAILYHVSSHGQIGKYSKKDYRYHSLDQDTQFRHDQIEIRFTDGTYEEIRQQKYQQGLANTILSFRSPYRYNTDLLVNESKAVNDIRTNYYGASTTADLDSKMEENFRRLRIFYQKYLEENDCRPSEARRYLIGRLNESISACLDLELVEIGDIESRRGTLYFRKQDQPKSFEFNLLSSGEKEVVDMLVDLYVRREDFSDSVFILDEPELHVSTTIQRKLLVEIDKLIGADCQIWISTHSIGFLRAIQENLADSCAIIEFAGLSTPSSSQHIITPSTPNHALWRRLFSIAIDDLAHLISPLRIVYCEGRAEPKGHSGERGLDAIVYNAIFCAKYPDTLFVSSGGNTELDHRSEVAVAIIGKALPSIEILVLKDRDMISSRESTPEDREAYLLLNPSNHRVLIRREIENYLFDREVLEEYTESTGKIFNLQLYSEVVKDIANQDVKSLFSHIKKCCGIDFSISADTFKQTLATHFKSQMRVYVELESCVFKCAAD